MQSPRHPLRRPLSGMVRALFAWQPEKIPHPLGSILSELDFVMDPDAYLGAVPLTAEQTGRALEDYARQLLEALPAFPDRSVRVKEWEVRLRSSLAALKK